MYGQEEKQRNGTVGGVVVACLVVAALVVCMIFFSGKSPENSIKGVTATKIVNVGERCSYHFSFSWNIPQKSLPVGYKTGTSYDYFSTSRTIRGIDVELLDSELVDLAKQKVIEKYRALDFDVKADDIEIVINSISLLTQ